jgi:hypothetical protein
LLKSSTPDKRKFNGISVIFMDVPAVVGRAD